MVLSNAERQARHRRRVREAVARGVTPDMIVKAARLFHESDPDAGPWTDYLANRQIKQFWQGNLPRDPDYDYAEFGEDAELMKKVAAVVRTVLYPPPKQS